MSETYKTAVLRHRAKARGSAHPDVHRSRAEVFRTFTHTTLVRPIHMALVEPVVGFLTLYIALNIGMTYAFFAAFPYVFMHVYGFDIASIGLTFLGLGGGCIVGCALMILFSRTVFRRHVERSKAQGHGGKVAPEKRLYLGMIGSICLPISLFWFGWSAQGGVHWICPVIAEGLYGLGNLFVFMSAVLYMMDFYGPAYGASAMAANNLARYLLGAAFPLFIVQMYEGLGIGWASSLLGFLSLCLTPIPWVFYVWGPKLREKTRYVKQ
nr:polyamine transporter 4 [Quercus suber]POE94789.1 polyamine transporter 4 [Quercus suber]